jgi:hypothetical protein
MAFYRTSGPTGTRALLNRALPAVGNRTFAAPVRAALGTSAQAQSFGQRHKFAVTPTEAGGHEVTLGDNETATISMNADGSCTVTVENKPAADNGANGNGAPASMPVVVEAAYRGARRAGTHTVSKMSWERDPATGGISFVPDTGETLDVDGDAIQAVVTTLPARPAI